MLKDNGSPYEFVLSRNCYVSESDSFDHIIDSY